MTNSSISKQTMNDEWGNVFNNFILPIYDETKDDPLNFCVRVHEYLRIINNIPFNPSNKYFNIFIALLQ